MREVDLDQAFKPTPEAFSRRVEQTLRTMGEEKKMKRFTIKTAALSLALVLALAGIAYAAIHFGQVWYYENRFDAYQKHEPQKHQAIMDSLQDKLPQQVTGPAAALVSLQVPDGAWVPGQSLATLSMVAKPVDEKAYELHSLWEMDVDGALVGRIDPEDEESRMDHWLWTKKGYGLPKDVMEDPDKQLLLIDLGGEMYIGDTQATLPGYSFDAFTTEEGPVMSVTEYNLDLLDDSAVQQMFQPGEVPQGVDEAEYLRQQEGFRQRFLKQAQASREAIEAHTDKEGMLSLRFPFKVQHFADGAYGEVVPGELRLRIRIEEGKQ